MNKKYNFRLIIFMLVVVLFTVIIYAFPPYQGSILKGDQSKIYRYFGYSVSYDGTRILVGQPEYSNLGPYLDSGRAYVFNKTGTNWNKTQLIASDGSNQYWFGWSVSIDDNRAVVGQPRRSLYWPGAAYVYCETDNVWTQESKLVSTLTINPSSNNNFGCCVEIENNVIVVGANNEWPFNWAWYGVGAVYVFNYTNNTWTETTKIQASDKLLPSSRADKFGNCISLKDNKMLIGIYEDSVGYSGVGAAYLFKKENGIWIEMQKLLASDSSTNDYFGFSVSLDDSIALIGAWGDDDNGSNSGSSYVFVESELGWIESVKLKPTDGSSGDYFGYSVSIKDNTAIIGAKYESAVGAVYVFQKCGDNWIQIAKLSASDAGANATFGHSVSRIKNGICVIGSPDWMSGNVYGRAYIYYDLYIPKVTKFSF